MLRSRLSLGLAAAATVLVAVALLRRRRRNSSILGESYDAKGLPQAMPPLSITPGTSAPAAAQQAPAPAAATTPAEVKQEAPNGGGSGRRARGSAVLLQGLQAKPEFNGREGRVLSYDEGRGRYSVRLLPTGSHAAKTLQVKPDNLADAPPKGQELSCAELCLLTLGEHASITAEQMHRVIEFLSGQHGQMTEADLSLLLRVVCCFGWHVASHRDRGTGGEAPCLIAHPEHGSGLVVVTQPERLGSISQVVGHPTPQGAAKCATLVNGADLFLSESMERAQYLSLNPEARARATQGDPARPVPPRDPPDPAPPRDPPDPAPATRARDPRRAAPRRAARSPALPAWRRRCPRPCPPLLLSGPHARRAGPVHDAHDARLPRAQVHGVRPAPRGRAAGGAAG